MRRFALSAMTITLVALSASSFGGTTYYTPGVVLPGAPPFTCAQMDYGHCTGIFFRERYWEWTWTKTSSDQDLRDGDAGIDCNCGGTADHVYTVDVTRGAGSSYEYSASTSWTVGAEISWDIVKDVFGVGGNASYTDSNTSSWGNSSFASVTIPVTCTTPAGKRYHHWLLWRVHTDTYTGPVAMHCHLITGTCAFDYTYNYPGNYVGTHKTRSLWTTSSADDMGCN